MERLRWAVGEGYKTGVASASDIYASRSDSVRFAAECLQGDRPNEDDLVVRKIEGAAEFQRDRRIELLIRCRKEGS